MGQALFLKPSLILKPASAAARGPESEPEGRRTGRTAAEVSSGCRCLPFRPGKPHGSAAPLLRGRRPPPPPRTHRLPLPRLRPRPPPPRSPTAARLSAARRERAGASAAQPCSASAPGARARLQAAPGAPLPPPRPRRSQSLPRGHSGPGRAAPPRQHVPAAGRAAHPAATAARRRRGPVTEAALPSGPARPRQPISGLATAGRAGGGRGRAVV